MQVENTCGNGSEAQEHQLQVRQQQARQLLLHREGRGLYPANFSDQDGQALLAMLSLASSAPPASSPAPAGNSAPSPALAKAAKAPKGVALAPGEATYEVGAVGAAARKQTKVTAITIYNTDPGYRAGRLIAVSSRYI